LAQGWFKKFLGSFCSSFGLHISIMGAPSGAKGGKGAPPPPGPPKDAAGPPKGKGKATPGFAPNMKAMKSDAFVSVPEGKVNGFSFVMTGIKIQRSDGSVPSVALAEHLKNSWGVGKGVPELLMNADEVFCTAAFLEAFHLLANTFSKEYTKTTVTKMGDGRGKQAEVQTEVVKRGLEDAIVMFEGHSEFGKEYLSMAEAWLLTNSGEGQYETEGRTWASGAIILHEVNNNRKQKTVSEETRQEKERLQRQKSMEKAEERRRCFEHWLGLAPAALTEVPWSTCKQTMFVGGGSGGCLLAEFDAGCAICLKPQKMMAVSEFLAEHMFHALDVPVASCRVVNWTEDEFHNITEHLLKAQVMIPGQEANVRTVLTGTAIEGDDLGIEYVGVLEFVPGHGLLGLEAQKALTEDSADRLYEGVGNICAVDALLNNLDRVPLPLWSNDGNLSNIMVSRGRTVAIDQQVNPVLEGPGLDRYFGKLRELVADLPKGVLSSTASTVKQAFLENTGTDVPDASMLLLLGGLSNTLSKIATLWRSGQLRKSIEEAEQAAMKKFDMSATDVGQTRVEAMAAFLRRTAEEIANIVSQP